jgi:hypothetical protein
MDSLNGKTLLRASLIIVALSVALPAFAQISIGIRIGPPPAPHVVAVRPVSPGTGYMWVEGYWNPVGNHYKWHDGYWSRPPYLGAHWVAPRHDGERFFDGYWDGEHGRVDHDHPWTPDRERDFRAHEHDRDVREREVREGQDARERDQDRGGNHDRDHEGDHDR